MHARQATLPLTLAVTLLASCSDPPVHYALSAPGVTVDVATEPFGYTVHDATGRAVLASRGAGAGDGYGAIGFAGGRVDWTRLAIEGYYQFDPVLDPWSDAPRVVEATKTGSDRLDLTLAVSEADHERRFTISFQLSASKVRVEAKASDGVAPRAFGAAFQTTPGEGFLGFGERFNKTNQRGVSVYSWPEEGGIGKGEGIPTGPFNPYPNGESMTYYPIPFFLSTAGYGFRLDSTWRNQFDLATDGEDRWRVWHIGPDLAYEIYLPVPSDPRPWPAQIVDSFTAETGRPMTPPFWALGPRRNLGKNATVNGVPEAQAMRDADLAFTAVDESTHFLPAGRDIGQEDFLRNWTAGLRKLGVRPLCYFNGYWSASGSPLQPTVDEGVAKGYFLKDHDGKPGTVGLISGSWMSVYTTDFTNPDATAWYQQTLQRAISLGYYGWMYDFGEYVQPDWTGHNGMTGEQLHNLWPVLYDAALHEAMEKSSIAGDWYAFARAGYTGSSQHVPGAWSGDPTASFEGAVGLPAMARAGINIGLSGVPFWGSDINGFKCIPEGTKVADGELFARWIQLGSMHGDMHDQGACYDPMSSGIKKATLWTSTDAQQAWKTYARLHTRLAPYMQALLVDSRTAGTPLVRHLFFEHPDRVDLASVDDAWYFGPALLSAPVVKRGARSRTLTLPAGHWLDWQDRKLLEGGQTVTLDAPLAKLPLLLRDGYLVPLLDPTIDTLDDGDHPGVIGPKEVVDVYDVVGLISKSTGAASFTLAGGGDLKVTWTGAFAAGQLSPAADEESLATCTGCYRKDDLGGGLSRVRISATDGATQAGGLGLSSRVARRVRWDLYLLE